MTDVAYLQKQPQLTEIFLIENRGESSWWVFCQPLAWDGLPLPTSRPVFFARDEAKARAWVAARQSR
ncbi:MAG: hypothetical protein ACI9W6_002846 [Motiliproteus sp.]|jgi:hypothetical protein